MYVHLHVGMHAYMLARICVCNAILSYVHTGLKTNANQCCFQYINCIDPSALLFPGPYNTIRTAVYVYAHGYTSMHSSVSMNCMHTIEVQWPSG